MRDETVYYKSSHSIDQGQVGLNWLIENGWVEILQDGRVIVNHDFYKIMQLLDAIILTWASEDKANEYLYPDFYCSKELEKCNYVQQFYPHCVFSSVNTSESFSPNNLKYSGFISNPAICMHSYIQYQNSTLKTEHPVVITAKGRCKRNEEKGFVSLERLLDFTMREIIFIGTAEYVVKKRHEYMEKAKQLIEELHLDGQIMLSNDPFFKKEDEIKIIFQKKFKLKYELVLKNPDTNHEVAVASFNYHNINFSKAYNIHLDDNRLAHTACVAFGLERLAYIFMVQKGVETCCSDLIEYIEKIRR